MYRQVTWERPCVDSCFDQVYCLFIQPKLLLVFNHHITEPELCGFMNIHRPNLGLCSSPPPKDVGFSPPQSTTLITDLMNTSKECKVTTTSPLCYWSKEKQRGKCCSTLKTNRCVSWWAFVGQIHLFRCNEEDFMSEEGNFWSMETHTETHVFIFKMPQHGTLWFCSTLFPTLPILSICWDRLTWLSFWKLSHELKLSFPKRIMWVVELSHNQFPGLCSLKILTHSSTIVPEMQPRPRVPLQLPKNQSTHSRISNDTCYPSWTVPFQTTAEGLFIWMLIHVIDTSFWKALHIR